MAEIGDLIRITKNSSYHNYNIGEKYIICEKYNSNYVACNINDQTQKGNTIMDSDFIIIYGKEGVLRNISKIENEINDINEKLDYIEKNKLKEIDLKVFNIYKIISISKSDIPETDKIEKISSILE